MQILGVFHTVFGGEMTIPRALIISFIGFCTVFVLLALLAGFVKLMGMVFDKTGNRKKPEVKTAAPEAPKGTPLPDNQSAGSLSLIDTDEQTAAVIMAIVSNKSGIPLNRLRFNSIRLLEDK